MFISVLKYIQQHDYNLFIQIKNYLINYNLHLSFQETADNRLYTYQVVTLLNIITK